MQNINAEVVVPLFYKGELEGLLTLDHKATKEPYVQSDLDLLEALASQAIIAIKNAQLYEEAITDSLTGLYHHKYFKLRLQEEIERAKRYHHPLSLLMLDLGHFKDINDRFGHPVGDGILKKVADILKKETRKVDIVARYGGEEFAVILPETGIAGAQVLAQRLHLHLKEAVLVADRLRKKIEEADFTAPTGERLKLTLSIGISYFGGEDRGFSPQELIKRADTALYWAKQKGRNRTEVWEEKEQG